MFENQKGQTKTERIRLEFLGQEATEDGTDVVKFLQYDTAAILLFSGNLKKSNICRGVLFRGPKKSKKRQTGDVLAGINLIFCKMKFKLMVHQQNFSEENLVINPRDYNGLQVGDIVEIYHPEDTFSRLLLQVKKLSTDFQQKDTISIEQSIASTFQLRAYLDVYLNRIEPSDVTLDMVEIIFKDQYMSRSDLWRFQRSLIDTCVYMGNKLMFAGLRLQVNEMWMNGEKLACGMIGKDTKVRSST